ncbi:hypothetical protein [Flaviaesturariibacter amylovorans]|uniref:Uncharacterized protein n=1 Tax=Flaviaesturariibacter amylovorans TaxID=1084520 RepID=A0ABP8HVN6_9BACT
MPASRHLHPRKTLRLLATFYGSYAPASLLLTAACVVLFRQHGISIFGTLFWLKLATLGVLYHFTNQRKAKQYFYYRNLGLSKGLLWGATLTFDFLLFLTAIILSYRLS